MPFQEAAPNITTPTLGRDDEASRLQVAASSGIATPISVGQKYHALPVTRLEAKEAKPWAHFVAGGIGGMTAAAITSPLDVLKTRLQSDFYQAQIAATRAARHAPLGPASVSASAASASSLLLLPRSAWLHFRETFQILSSIHRVEGWRALFKGLGPNLSGVVPARAINFYAYGNGKRVLSDAFNGGREAAWIHLCAAAFAGVVTGTATNPIWVVKTRLQLDKSAAEANNNNIATRRYRNSLDCVVQTVRAEGVRGLYRGLSASYLGVSESTLQWVLYERMKRRLREREERLILSRRTPGFWDECLSWGGRLGAAAAAKLFAAAATYPHEVVRTRLRQAPALGDGRVKYTGLVQCFRTIYREEGMAALYGGLTPHLLRVVPSAAIMFGMYELVLRVLDVPA